MNHILLSCFIEGLIAKGPMGCLYPCGYEKQIIYLIEASVKWVIFYRRHTKMRFGLYLYHYDDVIMTMLASQITSLTVVYSIVYSGVNQRKHQSSASLAFVWEIHRGPVNFPHKWPVTRKMFPFDDVIMWKFTDDRDLNDKENIGPGKGMTRHNLNKFVSRCLSPYGCFCISVNIT